MGGMMGASMDDGDYSSYEMMEGNEVSETWETEILPSGEAE
jgi:hypothetical protein